MDRPVAMLPETRLEPIPIDLLPPPVVRPWWIFASWSIFCIGSFVSLAALLARFYPTTAPPWIVAPALFSTSATALILGSTNTALAGFGFGAREREINRWFEAARARIGALRHDECRAERTACESITFMVQGNGRAEVIVKGRGMSGGLLGSQGYDNRPLVSYRGQLSAEKTEPRQKCARMAAALGGLFIVSLQTLSALAAQLPK